MTLKTYFWKIIVVFVVNHFHSYPLFVAYKINQLANGVLCQNLESNVSTGLPRPKRIDNIVPPHFAIPGKGSS